MTQDSRQQHASMRAAQILLERQASACMDEELEEHDLILE